MPQDIDRNEDLGVPWHMQDALGQLHVRTVVSPSRAAQAARKRRDGNDPVPIARRKAEPSMVATAQQFVTLAAVWMRDHDDRAADRLAKRRLSTLAARIMSWDGPTARKVKTTKKVKR